MLTFFGGAMSVHWGPQARCIYSINSHTVGGERKQLL